MTSNLTRGGLVPAKIVNSNTNDVVVHFMFNPDKYKISKTNKWTDVTTEGRNVPIIDYAGGEARTITLTLWFDCQAEGTDVTLKTKPLWDIMNQDTSKTNSRTGRSEPPPVAFEWGRLSFKAIVTQLDEEYVLFDEHGTPLRSQVTISLKEFVDESQTQAQVAGQSSGAGTSPSTTVTEGDRLDLIGSHRAIAAKNNMDNPLALVSGMKIKV